jgi:hypothetical protein
LILKAKARAILAAVKICQDLLLESKNPKHYAFDFADFDRFSPRLNKRFWLNCFGFLREIENRIQKIRISVLLVNGKMKTVITYWLTPSGWSVGETGFGQLKNKQEGKNQPPLTVKYGLRRLSLLYFRR